MDFDLAIILAGALTLVTACLISSGSRRWFGRPVVLTPKQYLTRCSIVASIILGTLFSLCQSEDFVRSVLDQKLLVLVTLATSVAADHFYWFQPPDLTSGGATASAVQQSSSMVQPISGPPPLSGRGQAEARVSTAVKVSELGLMYLGSFAACSLGLLFVFAMFFPRHDPEPDPIKFYQTQIGQYLIGAIVLLTVALLVVTYYACCRGSAKVSGQAGVRANVGGSVGTSSEREKPKPKPRGGNAGQKGNMAAAKARVEDWSGQALIITEL